MATAKSTSYTATSTTGDIVAGSVVAFQLSGTFVGTVTFESTLDGTNWIATQAFPVASSTGASTAAAAGIWRLNGSGFTGVRARPTAYTSGTITIQSVGYDQGEVFAT